MNVLSEILLSAETMASSAATLANNSLSNFDGNLLALLFGGLGIAVLFIYRALRENPSQITEPTVK